MAQTKKVVIFVAIAYIFFIEYMHVLIIWYLHVQMYAGNSCWEFISKCSFSKHLLCFLTVQTLQTHFWFWFYTVVCRTNITAFKDDSYWIWGWPGVPVLEPQSTTCEENTLHTVLFLQFLQTHFKFIYEGYQFLWEHKGRI